MNTPNTITFKTTDTTWVMRITADRRIEVNTDVDVTEAAQKVLDAMQHLLTQQRTWVGLNDVEIKKLVGNDKYSDLLTAVAIAVEKKLKARNT
jgi:RNA binding exosome subunit